MTSCAEIRHGSPLPFGSICFVVLVMRKGGESSWHLGCTSEVFHVHSYQDQFIQPGWAECVFIFSLGLYIVCLYGIALICLCVPILLCFPGQLSHLPYRSVTSLNEPPTAFATSTIAWVRS